MNTGARVPRSTLKPRRERPRAPHQQAGETELEQDERGEEIEPVVAMEQQQQLSSSVQRRQAEAQDVDMPCAPGEPGRLNRSN